MTRMVHPGGGLLAGAQTQPLQGLGFPAAWRPGEGVEVGQISCGGSDSKHPGLRE